MRKLVVTLSLVAAALIAEGSFTAAHAQYYSDYGLFSSYGPYYDCNGQRCYIGPPYTWQKRHGRYYRVPGQYYYPAGNGWFGPGWPLRGWPFS